MSLTDQELDRYARHLVLRQIGGPGQARIRAARVLVVGAGGLGSPCALYLAAAGVGTLGLADDDTVSLSNLQRQILFRSGDVGRPKVAAGAEALAALNPGTAVTPHPVRLTAGNVMAVIADYDLVTDGTDNAATRFLLGDACFLAQKPLVSAAVTGFAGQLATWKGWLPDAPCHRCLFAELPEAAPDCAETGVLGAATGVMGSLQALEVLKEITGAGTGMAGRLTRFDALAGTFRTLGLPKDPACPLCGRDAPIRDLSRHG